MLDTTTDPNNKKLTESLLASFAGLTELKGTDCMDAGKAGARQIIATGQPTSAAQIAQAIGSSEKRAEKILEFFNKVGLAFVMPDGSVPSMWAVSSVSVPGVPHRLTADAPDAPIVYPWCAIDTIYFAQMLGQTMHIRSSCSQTSTPISFTVHPDGRVENLSPATAVLSVVIPDGTITKDIKSSFCHYVNFFANEQAGKEWAEKQQAVTIKLLPVGQAAQWMQQFAKELFGQ